MKVCQAGSVLFQDWTVKFHCDPKRTKAHTIVNFPLSKGMLSNSAADFDVSQQIQSLCKFMEECLEQWLDYVNKNRSVSVFFKRAIRACSMRSVFSAITTGCICFVYLCEFRFKGGGWYLNPTFSQPQEMLHNLNLIFPLGGVWIQTGGRHLNPVSEEGNQFESYVLPLYALAGIPCPLLALAFEDLGLSLHERTVHTNHTRTGGFWVKISFLAFQRSVQRVEPLHHRAIGYPPERNGQSMRKSADEARRADVSAFVPCSS